MFGLLKRKPAGPQAVSVEPHGWEFTVEPGQTVLQAALARGLPWPFRCRVGSCTTCRCRLLDGKVKQLTDTSYVLTAEQLAQGYILACQSQAQGPLRVHLDKVRARLPVGEDANPASGS